MSELKIHKGEEGYAIENEKGNKKYFSKAEELIRALMIQLQVSKKDIDELPIIKKQSKIEKDIEQTINKIYEEPINYTSQYEMEEMR